VSGVWLTSVIIESLALMLVAVRELRNFTSSTLSMMSSPSSISSDEAP
jgi:hypothetical protein